MSESIRNLCRLAVVAAGVVLGSQAHAASVTIDAGAACTGFSFNGTTLTCLVDNNCVISGPSSASVGSQITLNATCPGATTITWSGATCSGGQTGSSCQTSEASAVNRTYTVTPTGGTGSGDTHQVNWTTGGTAPGSCSLSVSPSSGAGGVPVTLTADCGTGSGTIDVAWTGTGTTGCSTQFTVAGSALTCAVTAPAGVTTNWTASFSNSAGSASNNPRTATYTYNAGGGGGFANCPGGSLTIANQWGASNIDTAQFGTFGGGGQIMSIQFTVPSGWSGGSKISSWVEYVDGATPREYALSSVACDFSSTNALKTSLGTPMRGFAGTGFSIRYKSGSPSTTYPAVVGGQTYYINVRNVNTDGSHTCLSGSCRMRGAIPD